MLLLETSDLAGAEDIGGGAKMCLLGTIKLTKLTNGQEKAKCWIQIV